MFESLREGQGPRLSDAAGDPPDAVAGTATVEEAGEGPILPQPATQTARHGGHGRHFKRREIALAEGGKLVLLSDGAISQVSATGETVRTWQPDDPDWAGHGIRFGLHPQAVTIAPHGRRARDPKPPNG